MGVPMADEGFKRKLTAILSADAVGYSRLMAEDENATVKTMASYRELMSSLIKQHRGRVVDSPGDNLLAEFSSVVDAVQCAVAMQNEFEAHNAELDKNRQMQFRIGINLGDVIEEEERIYGDGVNIAARLESMADPGGICVSKTAFDQIESKLPLGYEYLGEQSVKNIPKPIGAYRVLMKPDAAGKVFGEKRFVGRFSRKTALAAIVVLLVVAGGLVGWNIYLQQSKKVEPASVEKMTFSLPEKPSIAVLPFDNMSGDQNQEYIADGITEYLITNLSKMPDVFVIAKESSFHYKDKSILIKQVSEELGVRYVLEGSIQKSGDRTRITAQLIDALKGHHLWAEKYDREMKEFFALQDDIVLNILQGLQVQIASFPETFGAGTKNIEAYLKVLKGVKYVYKYTKEDFISAEKLYNEAIALDPEYAEAYRLLGWLYLQEVTTGFSNDPELSIKRAEDSALKAIELNDSLGSPHALLAFINVFFKGQYEDAIVEGEKAIELDPNAAENLTLHSLILTINNKCERALMLAEKAIRLNPYPSAHYFEALGNALNCLERYKEAVVAYKKGISIEPNRMWSHADLATIYILLGQEEDAKAAASEVVRINPQASLEFFAKFAPFADQDKLESYLDLLRKAGIPEHSTSN
jgi:adenylate cyclase